MKAIATVLASLLLLSATPALADSPMFTGFYVIHYALPGHPQGIGPVYANIRKSYDSWAYAETFISEDALRKAQLVAEVKQDTGTGKDAVARSGKSKEEYLKQLESDPGLKPENRQTLWINLNRAEGLSQIFLSQIVARSSQESQKAEEKPPQESAKPPGK